MMLTTLHSSYFKAVVVAIIIAKAPLYRGGLKHFLGRLDDEDDRQFSVILRSLSSVVELDGVALPEASFIRRIPD